MDLANKEYELGVALLQFRAAYSKLVKAAKQLPDYDISKSYPFYILDFEEIEPAVLQWCMIHSSNLLSKVPDKVDNPACASCKHLRSGISTSGQCVGNPECPIFPVIAFSMEQVVPFLVVNGIEVAKIPASQIGAVYTRKMDELYERRNDDHKAND